jgi:general L-amino acid transport system permease protein
MASATQPRNTRPLSNLLRDSRVLQIIGQTVFAVVIIALIFALASSILSSLQAKNLTPNFSFLRTTAGFDISETPDWYSSSSTYWMAFQVGVINTIRVAVVGLIATTILGVLVGIFLLSNNWLIRNISQVYVELLRNTPLLVQLFAWYFIVMYSLPTFQQSIALPQESMTVIPVRLLIYLVLALVVWRYRRRYGSASPRARFALSALAAGVLVIEVGFWLARTQAGWERVFGSANILAPGFLLYLVASLLLIGASWFVIPQLRSAAMGAAVGQLIGGLIFYFGVLPSNTLHFELHPAVFINIRGFAFPELVPTARFAQWMAFVGIGVALAIFLWIYMGHLNETTDGKHPRLGYTLLAIVGFAVAGWMIVGLQPAPTTVPVQQDDQTVYMPVDEAVEQELLTPRDEALYSTSPLLVLLPQKTNFKFTVGSQVSPEYMALLLGLVVYSSAFIAEIVRAGIQAVPKGQVEAARALGFSTGQVLRMIILPQALRVIIPPLGNQYLNLTKNSSLATAVAFADIYLVSISMASTSGQSVPIIIMVMITYLIMSLTIATVMNWVNRRFQLVTR